MKGTAVSDTGRTVWANVALSVAASILALLCLELTLRLVLPTEAHEALPHFGLSLEEARQLEWLDRRLERPAEENDSGDGLRFDRPDALLGWSPIPDIRRRNVRPDSFDTLVSTNADGLRGPVDVPHERVPGRTRIATFGCSQTFGAEVSDDETYSARLESMLTDVEVLNFGVHGFGSDQMLLRYERDGIPFHPDIVILGFAYYHVERNVETFRFFAKPRFVPTGDGIELVGEPVPTPEEFAMVARHPETFSLLDKSVLARWSWERLLRYREGQLYRSDSEAWALTTAIIERFANEARAHGSRFIVLNLEDGAPYVAPHLESALTDFARRGGFDLVNAGPLLRDIARTHERLRVPKNPHWGPAGHRVLAEQLRNHICQAGLVSPAQCDRHDDR